METKNVIHFCSERGWAKYHNMESLSRTLSIEASEVEKSSFGKILIPN